MKQNSMTNLVEKKENLVTKLSELCEKFMSLYESGSDDKSVYVIPLFGFSELDSKTKDFNDYKFYRVKKERLIKLNPAFILTSIDRLKTFFVS